MAMATGLEPGNHTVSLQFRRGRRVEAEGSVEIAVAKRSPEQEAFLKSMASD